MIDTVGVQYYGIRIDWSIYYPWPDGGGKGIKVWHGITVTIANGATFQFTYFPYVMGGLLKVEFSLPHVVFGNNVQMVFNIEEAIHKANEFMPSVPGIPDLDLWEGVLYRLDVCYNFQVGDLVLWYIKALQYLEYDYRRTKPYTSQGVQFENSQGVLKIYDKERERRDEHDLIGALLAHGYLRLEYEMWRKTIQRLTGEKRPTLRNITVSLLLDVLENELQNLELLGRSIHTVNTTFKVLREKYENWEALALIGLLTLKMEHPSLELLAGDAGLHPNSINRHIQKKFIENGLPPTLTEYSEPLPPLIIDREYVISQSRKEE